MHAKVAIGIGSVAVLALVLRAGAAPQVVMGAGGQTMSVQTTDIRGPGLPGLGASTPMTTGTGLIFGRTTEPEGTRAVAGAVVTLSLPGFAPSRVLSDGQGRFAFRDLPKGRFSLSATKAGYSDGAYGRERPSGPANTIDLADDQHVSDAAVSLWKFATIAGVVVDDSGEPIIGATVRALKRGVVAGKRQFSVAASDTTDDRGMYRISGLEPAQYAIALPMSQGNASLDSLLQGMDLPREALGGLPGGAGGGGGGGAAFTMNVQVSSSGGLGGGTSISYQSSDAPGMAPGGMTDDGHLMWYQTMFYPTALSASRATLITIGSGEQRDGIDFQLKPVRTVNVTGMLMAPDGPAASTTLSLFPAEADDLVTPIETATTSSDATGTFTFANVPPAQYTLRAVRMPRMSLGGGETQTISSGGSTMVFRSVVRTSDSAAPPLPTDPTLWVEETVSVGGSDIKDLVASLRAGVKISGRVEFDGSAQKPTGDQLSAIAISLDPADGRTSGVSGAARGRVDSNGTFTTMGVPAGRYVLRVSAPKDWSLRGGIAAGRDITDTAVELRDGDLDGVVITFTDKPTSLTGTVTDASGAADGKAAVIVFPTDRTAWSGQGRAPRREKNVRTGQDGSFSISNVPAGEYFVVAVSDASAGDWDDPAFLAAIAPAATRLKLAEGDTQTQSLHTTKVPGR